ncbi:MAG: DUF885 family protein, partial [Burkholderiaceae bacterium]
DDRSPEAAARRDAHARERLAALRKVDRDALTGEDRISYDCALIDARRAVDDQRYPALRTRVLSALQGVQLSLPALMRDMPARNELDARNALARLKAMPRRIAQDMAWAREGKRLGWVTFRGSLGRVADEIDALVAMPPADSPLVDPFRRLPGDLPDGLRQALREEAIATLRDQVLPAFLELRKMVVDELLPASPDNGAMGAYPDGDAIYRLLLREQATLPVDANAANRQALAEVALLHARIAEVIGQTGFSGGEAEFVEFVNHDPRFFYAKADDLLLALRDIAKRVDPELTRLFLVLPRTPYGIRAIPAFEGPDAAESTTAGAVDGSSPGWLNVNVVALSRQPAWRMEDLFLNHGMPGRHLQNSRARELALLPAFRRVAQPEAYVDGWAQYCEGLGRELGLYEDPYARYGQLQAELARAARLAVDTGIHALGWTRAQAIDYLIRETGASAGDAAAEVDRCITQPARALGGEIGRMKLVELRQKARSELGARFDLRAFHQELLDHGALPLPVLDGVIADWIGRVKAEPAPP